MPEFIFTFGSNHKSAQESYLAHRFCAIEAETEDEARQKMFAVRGASWAFCYPSREEAGVSRHGLNEVPLDRLSPNPEFSLRHPTLRIKDGYVYAGDQAFVLPWGFDLQVNAKLNRVVSASFELYRACVAQAEGRLDAGTLTKEALAKAEGV